MAGPDWKLEAEHLARKNKRLRAALEEAQQWLVGLVDPDGLSPEDRECLERIDAALGEDAPKEQLNADPEVNTPVSVSANV